MRDPKSYTTNVRTTYTERCRSCGCAKQWHREEPAHYGAEWLEPSATTSVAARDHGCTGWDPERMTLAEAMSRKGQPSR